MTFESLVHYLRLGGVTMIIIVLASVIALFVAIERVIALWGVSQQARELGQTVARHLLRGDVASAVVASQRSRALAAEMYLAGFERLERARGKPGAVESAIERERTQVTLKMRRNLWLLGTIGAVTPFIGLFGTVAGIMRSFKDLGLDVESGGTGGTAAVMSGISEALIATAAGILVAVEAVILYNYFQTRLQRVAVELRLLGDEFAELLRELPPNATVPPVAAEVSQPPETSSASVGET